MAISQISRNFQYCVASILKILNAYLVSYFNSNEFSRSVIECFSPSVYQAPDSPDNATSITR